MISSIISGIPCNPAVLAAFGKEACGKFKGLPKGFVFTPDDFSFDATTAAVQTPEDVVDMLNSFVHYGALTGSDIRTPNEPQISPYYAQIVNIETTGGDPNIVQEGFGGGVPNGINAYSEVYTITDGGDCMFKQLSKLIGQEIRVFKIDDKDVLYGTMDRSGMVRGYRAYVTPYDRPNSGTTTAAIMLSIVYSTTYQQERAQEVAIYLGQELETMRELSLLAVPGVATQFQVVTSCSGQSITKGNPTLAQDFVTNKGVFLLADGTPYAGTLTYAVATDSFVLEQTDERAGLHLASDMYNVGDTLVDSFMYFLGDSELLR